MKLPQESIIQFKNCSLLRNHQILKEDLWVRDGKIINPENIFFDEKEFADITVDCLGTLIAPGYIELQINGGFGVDFSKDLDEASLQKVAKGLLSHGVTSFCPTLVTSPPHVYKKILPLLKKKAGNVNGATVLGAHVEGPFINPEKKGAHPPQCMKNLENGLSSILEVYGSLDNISILTLAPEIDGALPVIKQLTDLGITVSVGHSMADLNQGEAAVKHGASLITHLFNAMLPFHHRDPGLVGLLASDAVPEEKTVYFGIIADGVHTHPAALRIAHRTHPKGLVIVTDAVSALGLQEGTHSIGQMTVEIKGSKALVSGTNTLCGSITSMSDCVKFFRKATGCSIVEALESATLHPAQAIKISHQKGTLNFGSDADFILLNKELDVVSTWIAGQVVYEAQIINKDTDVGP